MTKVGLPDQELTVDEFRELLVKFAASRGLATSGVGIGWVLNAVISAAKEHPELNFSRRSRGRPKKEALKRQGLLGVVEDYYPRTRPISMDEANREEELLDEIEFIHQYALDQGFRNISDKEALDFFIKAYPAIYNKEDRSHVPSLRRLQNMLSAARRRFNRPRVTKNSG